MSDIADFGQLFQNPKILITTLVALFVGAVFGVVAFYNGWLG